jgi:hypothetical protein
MAKVLVNWIPLHRILDRMYMKVTIQNNKAKRSIPGGFK